MTTIIGGKARMRRVGISFVVGLLLVCAGGVTSYSRARRVAEAYVNPRPPDVAQFHTGFVPLRRTGDGRWAWSISYGPQAIPGHVGFEVYVSPAGRLIGTNPVAFDSLLNARRAAGEVSSPVP